jgi:hypothetical protein
MNVNYAKSIYNILGKVIPLNNGIAYEFYFTKPKRDQIYTGRKYSNNKISGSIRFLLPFRVL